MAYKKTGSIEKKAVSKACHGGLDPPSTEKPYTDY